MFEEFEDHTDIPVRVATGRAVRATIGAPYRTLVSRALSGAEQPSGVFEDAVNTVYRHQEDFIEATLTHPYDWELLAQAGPGPERVEAAPAVLAARPAAPRVVTIQVLADIIHAAEADGVDPHELR